MLICLKKVIRNFMSLSKLIGFIFIISQTFSIVITQAQNLAIDALYKKLENSSDTSRAKVLNELSNQILYGNPEESKRLADEALLLSNTLKYNSGIINAQVSLANYFEFLGKYNEATPYLVDALDLSKKINDLPLLLKVYYNLANHFQSLSKFDSAMMFTENFLKISLDLNDSVGIGKAYGTMGVIYESKGDHLSCLHYYFDAAKYLKK
jgi:tetratricopeptide (TPR) repeat protein